MAILKARGPVAEAAKQLRRRFGWLRMVSVDQWRSGEQEVRFKVCPTLTRDGLKVPAEKDVDLVQRSGRFPFILHPTRIICTPDGVNEKTVGAVLIQSNEEPV